ncbi:MAG: RDD family protein [Elusimicrobia bacterium]|nr:RDD family protein [Elusimicrobiota bacterium]
MEQPLRRPPFSLRAGAAAVDGAVLFVVFYAVGALALALAGGSSALENDPALERPFIRLTALILTAISAAYFTALTGKDGQTLGKKLAGIAVVTPEGARIGYGKAFLRWVGYQLCVGTLGGGFVMAALSEHQRGLHDVLAGTRVVVANGIGQWRKAALATAGIVAALALTLAALAMLAEIVFSFLR